MRAFACSLVVAVAVVGCDNKDKAVVVEEKRDDIVDAAIAAQNVRVGAVRDYAVEGDVVDRASGQAMKFRYAMQQPSYSVGELLDAQGGLARAFVFDGKVLAIVDATTKTVTHQDLTKNEEQTLLTLHEIFSQFVCEGWRPPLIRPRGTVGSAGSGADGGDVVLSVPVDDPAIASQRLTLKSDGAFVKKELLDKGGNVLTSTTVLESVVDPATKLSFPKKWAHSENGSTQEVTLSSFAVNAGVDPGRFNTNADFFPPGDTPQVPAAKAPPSPAEPRRTPAGHSSDRSTP